MQQKIICKSLLLGVQAGIAHIGTKPAGSDYSDSLAQRIRAILHGRRIGQLHPAHYKLIKNLYFDSKPSLTKDVETTRILNGLLTSDTKSPEVRNATDIEIRFYKRAISIWPALKAGAKAAALQSGIRI